MILVLSFDRFLLQCVEAEVKENGIQTVEKITEK